MSGVGRKGDMMGEKIKRKGNYSMAQCPVCKLITWWDEIKACGNMCCECQVEKNKEAEDEVI